MPKIDFQIGQQAFELIRARVYDILLDELSGQTTMSGIGLYAERNIAFSAEELPAVNIRVAQIDNSNKHQGQSRQEQLFTIDCVSAGKSGVSTRGDFISATKAHQIAGVCRYILEDTRYKTLGYTTGFIERVFVRAILFNSEQTTDTDYITTVRLELTVQAVEVNTLVPPRLLEGYETTAKLEDSNTGFFRTT